MHENYTHLAHVVISLNVGGTERLVEKMLRNPPDGFRASCICLDSLGPLGEKAVKDGLTVSALRRRPGVDLGLPFRIADFCRANSVQILHCHQYTPWFYGVLARVRHPGLKILFTEHGRFYPDIPSTKRRLFNRMASPFTHGITAVSPATRLALVEVEAFPAHQVEVVFNGVDPLPFDLPHDKEWLRSKLGLRPQRFYFILCARFDKIKWMEGLVRAFKKVVERFPDSGLILVGDGEEKESLQKLTRESELDENVLMPGFQDNIPEWLKAADAFVLSSLSEGTSVSLIESMAAELPCVASRVGGNEFVMRDGETGYLVEPRNESALAEGMLRLLSNPEKRAELGKNARRRFEAEFTLGAMFANYKTLYHKIRKDHSTAHALEKKK